MIVEINHPIYGRTELNVERVIAICPEINTLLFENIKWNLSEQDFNKVASIWRDLYN